MISKGIREPCIIHTSIRHGRTIAFRVVAELTLPQAVRLWTLGVDDCRYVIDALVDVGFLKWTNRRTIVRTGRDLPVGREPATSNIPVRRTSFGNKSVQQQR